MALVIGWHETLLRDWKYRGEMRSDSSIGPDGGGVNACVRRQEISLRRDAQPWHRPPAVVARTPGCHAQLACSSAIASTIGWCQRRSVTAVPWTLIPAPRITEHEVDAEPSLRAASGSLRSACSHAGWRPAPRPRLIARDLILHGEFALPAGVGRDNRRGAAGLDRINRAVKLLTAAITRPVIRDVRTTHVAACVSGRR